MSWEFLFDFCDNEGIETETTRAQKNDENYMVNMKLEDLTIKKNCHRDYWLKAISGLPKEYTKLNFQDPWIPYWFLNTMHVLSYNTMSGFKFYEEKIVQYLSKRKSHDGGYASSPELIGNVVLAYVAVNSLCIIGTESAYKSIDRESLYKWFLTLKRENGSFYAGKGSESDVRSTYCVLAVCSLLNIMTTEITKNCAVYFASCQGYDGGFSPNPGSETHGAFGYCAISGLSLLGKLELIDINAAIRWCAMRQMQFSGGFNGRTNKLADSCYNWWIGAMSKILSDYLGIESFWNDQGLCDWVLRICQKPEGGLSDRPHEKSDFFHTMYSLCGISATSSEYIQRETGIKLAEIDIRQAIPTVSVTKSRRYFL